MSDLFTESHTPEGGCEVKVHEDAERAPEGWVELANELSRTVGDKLDHVHVSGSRIGLRHQWNIDTSDIITVADEVVKREGFDQQTKSVIGSFTCGDTDRSIEEIRVDAQDPPSFMS